MSILLWSWPLVILRNRLYGISVRVFVSGFETDLSLHNWPLLRNEHMDRSRTQPNYRGSIEASNFLDKNFDNSNLIELCSIVEQQNSTYSMDNVCMLFVVLHNPKQESP